MLGDDLALALPEMRAQAESMMQDTIRVEKKTGEKTTDPETLAIVDVWALVYEGPGRVQRPATQPGEPVVGEVEFGTTATIIQLPLSATGFAREQRVTVAAVGSLSDPALVGMRATVLSVPTKTHPTMRRLYCEEVA